ncbi:DUF4142 domain-containing protein [Dyella monticola]|uniref:DUF4142 domain-containing protein n=1 Tax=Dyella monticola TaxID=1927958 RepID=UPI0013147F57|nr:DUF4142 domain-containing protein [Dyella monticola]
MVPLSLVLMWLVLGAGLAQAADNGNSPLNSDEQAFLERAMSDNASQIALAKLAIAKSINPRVLQLATTIVQERTALNARMAQLMPNQRAAGTPMAGDDPTMDRLQALNGDAFDKTFTSALVRSHCRAISAYEAVRLNASNLSLKDLTHEAIPQLRGDLMVAIAVLRSSGWTAPAHHPEAIAAADTHAAKAAVFWEPISLVAAPW